MGTLAPERIRALRHVATIESIGSSTRIEGSKLSDREVERLLSNLEIGSFASRDEQEVAVYAGVMETVSARGRTCHLAKITSSSSTGIFFVTAGWTRGIPASTKKLSNSVAAIDEQGGQIGIVFETATPFDTPQLMTELVDWFNQARKDERGVDFAASLKAELRSLAAQVEAGFPTNSELSVDRDGTPHLKQLATTIQPKGLAEFERELRARMPERHLLDILKHTEHWSVTLAISGRPPDQVPSSTTPRSDISSPSSATVAILDPCRQLAMPPRSRPPRYFAASMHST